MAFKSDSGNISILFLVILSLLFVFFIFLFDCLNIFITREKTKNVSDSLSLAISQNVLSFKQDEIDNILLAHPDFKKVDDVNVKLDYDEVTVKCSKKISTLIIGKLFLIDSVSSISKTKIIYPWDEYFEDCKRYKFEY